MSQGGDEPAAIAETHISVVVFVGDRAYKLKKPVHFGFLDLSTRERREAICHREVELNRRLAPDVYLGVADVHGPDGSLSEHLVVMRRMPAERRLSALVRAGVDVDDDLREIARTVAAFHATARTAPEIDAASTYEAMGAKWDANVRESRRFAGALLDAASFHEVVRLAKRYVAGRGPLFAHRIALRKARDGHGDLLADDIFCLPDGPRILDCIEFDDALRYGDVLADVAFLAMDLEHLGAAELGRRFLSWYREFSAETHPDSLADFYVAHRAFIRMKVACLRHEQGDAGAAAGAGELLAMALDHLERGRIRLVLVGGLPGTGKSKLSRAISEQTGWTVIRSDEVRKDVAGIGHLDRRSEDFGQGIYGPDRNRATYRELLRRAGLALGFGESVVLDASWSSASDRSDAAVLAEEVHADLHQLVCVAPDDVAAARLARRLASGDDASDATPAVHAAMAVLADDWPEAIVVDTSGPPERSADSALGALGVTPTRPPGS